MTDNRNAYRSHAFRLCPCRRAASAHPAYIPRTILGSTPDDRPQGSSRRSCPNVPMAALSVVPEAGRRAALLAEHKCSARTLPGGQPPTIRLSINNLLGNDS